MLRTIFFTTILYMLTLCQSCQSKSKDEEAPVQETDIQTPVTVVPVTPGPLNEYMELNATATFLQSNIVKASANGYLKAVNVSPGQFVVADRTIFVIQTKEAKNIGTIINNLDSSFRFSGTTYIKAAQSGYITQLNHQAGDYVQDGEQLAAISTANSFGFLLNTPFELNKFVTLNKEVEVLLPDGTQLAGKIASIMPAVDSVSQTQRMLVRVNSAKPIPENLIVKVKILKIRKANAITLPREAILSDESQTNFWVMKMLDSVTAVKVTVTRGLEVDNKVEILQPLFTAGDQIIINGNYGLADTAHVKIVKPE